jgi:hypothetical protein
VAEKIHYTTLPPAQCTALWGEGEGGCYCYLYDPEDLLIKNVSYTEIIIKSILKVTFLMQTFETKKFVKIFLRGIFDF